MSEGSPSYEIFLTDKADEDREHAVFRLIGILGPESAAAWGEGLLTIIEGLPNFPGPLANAIDKNESTSFGCEVRKLLYSGSRRRKSGAAYHVQYTIMPPDAENVRMIRVLRLLHAMRGTVETVEDSGEHNAGS